MVPFETKGEKAEWQMIYESLLAEADHGTVISYADIDRVLGRDFKSSRTPIYRAMKHLGREKHRWLMAMPKVGYRVIDAPEHMALADHHKMKGKHQLQKTVEIGVATDVSRLSSDELARLDMQLKVNTLLLMAVKAHEDRLNRIEDLLRREGMMA